MIRVVIPVHLRRLAGTGSTLDLQAASPCTITLVLDALEAAYPALRGTLRDQVSGQRRPFIRFFACGEDLTQDSPDAPLPQAVQDGSEPLRIVGAMVGG